jgi:hypothetical protein
VDEALGSGANELLHDILPDLRAMLCSRLNVPEDLAHFVVITVKGLTDQAPLSVEAQILPKPERTRDGIRESFDALRDALTSVADVRISVRVTTVDPDNYLVLR